VRDIERLDLRFLVDAQHDRVRRRIDIGQLEGFQAVRLQPNRVRQFKLSRDPEFVAKLRDIVGLGRPVRAGPGIQKHQTTINFKRIGPLEARTRGPGRRAFYAANLRLGRRPVGLPRPGTGETSRRVRCRVNWFA
jgi:hypothetical protein